MADPLTSEPTPPRPDRPSATVVFLVYNRRAELGVSLTRMLGESDYRPGRVDVIVVDNASTDGVADMVRDEFPQVQLIVREHNIGVSGWNEGLAAARGDYILALDDDCYLPPDGLRRAVEAAESYEADLVSFRVISTYDPEYVFTEKHRTGLFTFWGCAVLMRRRVIEALGGYDPEIFVWANELEFTLRFFDHGFRHLHYPEVVAQHMKAVTGTEDDWFEERPYRINARHFAYIAGKLLGRRDATEALVALLARAGRDGLRLDRGALNALPDTLRGFVHGVRHRQPVANSQLSRFYRHNFEVFASPWWLSRSPLELLRALPRELLIDRSRPQGIGRQAEFYTERSALYPDRPRTLRFGPDPMP